MKIVPDTLPLPKEPYRGILPFRLLDWRIFLERDIETERLANFVSLYRGVLLYGQSGTGKSSLLNAGLIPHALRRGRAPERIRVFPERGRELLIERIQLQEEDTKNVDGSDLPHYLPSRFTFADNDERFALSCDEFLQTLRASSNPESVPLLIFDQFEELVTLFEENPKKKLTFEDVQKAREAIEKLLCDLLINEPLPVKIIFSFRDDYFARLTPIFLRIPNLLDRGVLLDPPRIERLKTIVRGPFVKSEDGQRGLPGHFKNESSKQPDELNEELADKMESGIRTAHPAGVLNLSELQTLCLALWRDPKRREELLRADNPAVVLQQIIESTAVDALKKLLPWDRIRARALLANLVTQEGTRDVVSQENLISETRRNPLMLVFPRDWRKLLDGLPEKTGLLRRSLSSGTTYYELASEFLISWIQKRQRAFRRLALWVSGSISVGLLAMVIVLVALAWRLHDQTRVAKQLAKEATAANGKVIAREAALKKSKANANAAKKKAVYNEAVAKESAAIATAVKIGWRGVNKAQQKLDLALLLSTEAVRKSQATIEARNALFTCLLSSPHLSTFLRGHKGTVRCLAFSPDGTTLASAGADGFLIFWNPYTGYMTQAPKKAHAGSIFGLAFSPNGKNLASASDDHTVKIWDVRGPEQIASLPHNNSIHDVAFSPNGTRLATAGADNTVRIWDAKTGKELQSLKAHENAVHTVAFSADNKWLASAGEERKIILWDARSLRKQHVIPVKEDEAPIFKILFSADSKSLLASSAAGVITTWDIATRKQAIKPFKDHTRGVYSMNLSKTQLASASSDRTVKLRGISIESGAIETLSGYSEKAYSVAFTPSGEVVVAGFADGVIGVWDFSNIAQLVTPIDDAAGSVNGIALGPGGKVLAIAQGSCAVLWDVEQRKWLTPVLSKNALPVECVAISPDGKIAASGSDDQTVRLWNVETGKQIGYSLSGHTDSVWTVAFSHDGKNLASGGGTAHDNSVRVWDVGSRGYKTLKGQTGGVRSLSFSPDDQELASASSDGTIRRWDVKTGNEIGRPLTSPNGDVYRVAFGSQALACTNLEAGITLWDFSSKEVPPRLLAAKTRFANVSFDRDGRTLLSTRMADGVVFRWNATNGEMLGTPPKEGAWSGITAAFSPGATHVAVISDGKATISDLGSAKKLGEPILINPGEVIGIANSPLGDTIVARASGRVTVLDGKTFLPKGKPIQQSLDLANIASSPTANILACATGNHVTLWDTKTNQQYGEIEIKANATRVIFSPDGKHLAVGDDKGNASLWNVQSLQKIDLPFEAHTGPVVDLAFHPREHVLFSTGGDKKLIRQPLDATQRPVTIRDQYISRITISPDGTLIACGMTDGQVVLVGAVSQEQITLDLEQPGTTGAFTDWKHQERPINHLVFSRDGKLLASSAAEDSAVLLWDVENRKQFGPPLSGHTSQITALNFTSDGKYLLSADASGVLFRWDINVEDWQKSASMIAGRNLSREEWRQYMGKETYNPSPDAWLALKKAVNAFFAGKPEVGEDFAEAVNAAKQSTDPAVNNAVCWEGSVRDFASVVVSAGKRSVELAKKSDEKNVGYYQDTLALALALTHDRHAAIENFKAYVRWAKDHGGYEDIVAKREEWIRGLEAGHNPFTAETLKELRKEQVGID